MAVHIKRKLVSSNVDIFEIKEDTNISEIISRMNLPEMLHEYFDVAVDGITIPMESWNNTTVGTNNVVFIAAVPRGGGDSGGKNPLAAVAGIALMFFAPWAAGPAGLGLTGGAATAATAGIMFVGSLLISALFPPPKPSTPGSEDDSTGFFGMEGLRNRSRPYDAVRSIYGEYKVAPDLAVESYQTTNGDVQTVHAIYDFGYGDVDISNILIGNTPINNYAEILYSVNRDYTYSTIPYYVNDNATETFSTEIVEYSTDGELVWAQRTSLADNTSILTMNISFPLGLGRVHERDGLQSHKVGFQLQGRVAGTVDWHNFGEGSYFSTSHGITYDNTWASRMEFDDLYTRTGPAPEDGAGTWTLNQGTTYNVSVKGTVVVDRFFSNETVPKNTDIRPGATFTRNGVVHTIQTAVRTSGPTYNYITTDTDPDSIGVTTYTKWWDATYRITISPIMAADVIQEEMVCERVCVDTEYSYYCSTVCIYQPPANDPVVVSFGLTEPPYDTFYLERRTLVPFVFSAELGLPYEAEWEIRLRRTDHRDYTDNAHFDDQYYDKTDLVAITSKSQVIPLKFDVPHTILSLQIRSSDQLSGTVDTLSATCKRKINTWDRNIGAWTDPNAWSFEHSSNPAWIALDILTGSANSDPIPNTRIDFDAFYEWSLFCSEQVLSDTGVWEDKYRCDANFDASSTVNERIRSIMSVGRATLSLRENKYSVIWERFPTVSTQLLTTKNSSNFKGTKVFTKTPHALKCMYVDPASEWRMTETVVYNDGYAEVAGGGDLAATYFESINMPLVTRYSQAFRDTRYFMAQGQLRPETFSLSTDIENLICERGDLIQVQHDVAKAGGQSSRVVSISGVNVTLREQITIPAAGWQAEEYIFSARLSSSGNVGDMADYAVNEIAMDTAAPDEYTVVLTSDPSATLSVGDLCVLGIRDVVTEEFLVKSIYPSSDLSAVLEMVPIARDIQTADTTEIPEYVPYIYDESEYYPKKVAGLRSTSSIFYENRMPYVDVEITWYDVKTNPQYEIWYTEDANVNYRLMERVTDPQGSYFLFDNKSPLDSDYPNGGYFFVKVLPINTLGLKPSLEESDYIAVYFPSDNDKPGKPVFFAGDITDKTMNLSWLPPTDSDIGGFVLKYFNNYDVTEEEFVDTPWEYGEFENRLLPYNTTSFSVNARLGTYMLKTIDTSGNLSDAAAIVRTTIPALPSLDPVSTTIDQHPTFGGVKTSVEVIGTELSMTEEASSYLEAGVYNFDEVADLGAIYKTYITSYMVLSGRTNDAISEWDLLSNVELMSDTTDSDINVMIQVRTVNVKNTLSSWGFLTTVSPLSDPTNDEWSGWQEIHAGYYTGRYFDFRAILTSQIANYTPVVHKLSVSLALPERTIAKNNIICADTGCTVLFDNAFRDPPVIGITEDNAAAGQYYQISNLTSAGFDIQFLVPNAGGTYTYSDIGVAAQFDYTAVGVGEVLTSSNYPLLSGEDDDISELAGSISAVNNFLLF